MGVHRIHIDEALAEGLVVVGGDEGHHAARVKRVEVGERVEVLDGKGGLGRGLVAAIRKERDEWVVEVKVERLEKVGPVKPRVEVYAAVPKGGRLSEMIDGLAQVGAALWRPLIAERGVRETWKREKAERVAVEASKQCGRAWRMEIGEEVAVAEAVRRENGVEVVMADASGERYESRGELVRVLIGPEGGWSDAELAAARQAGVRVCRFGVHTMRIETAAVVAAGIVMSE